jgi:hypothetical protein
MKNKDVAQNRNARKNMQEKQALVKVACWATVACLIIGCATDSSIQAPVSGLKPVYPEARLKTDDPKLIYVQVNSLHPTLRWEPFSTYRTNEQDTETFSGKIQNIKYDLKIWRVKRGHPQGVVYKRKGLRKPTHKIKTSLRPSTQYFWSVRARFELNGQTRVSEWSLSQLPNPLYDDSSKKLIKGSDSRQLARILGRIPVPNFFRFKTPSINSVKSENTNPQGQKEDNLCLASAKNGPLEVKS